MIGRRQVLQGFASAASLPLVGSARAASSELKVISRVLDVKGKAAKVYGIVGPSGKQGLDLFFGDGFDFNVINQTDVETLIHWHGLTPPVQMDGTPMLSGPTLAAGETRQFKFDNLNVGTHWMHSHFGLQAQKLLAAPLIVREKADSLVDEQEHVVLVHDFTFREPEEILSELQGGGGAHAAHGTVDHSKMDHSKMTGGAMAAMTQVDVKYDALLANDRTLNDPEVVRSEKAGRFRLRVINASAATNVWVELGEIEGEIIAVDGHMVRPIKGKRFPLAVAQRADIRLTLPSGSGAWPVLFQSEGDTLRGGIILQSGNGAVSKISDQGEAGAALDLELEAQLVPVGKQKDEPVSRVEMVMLTGGGADYTWGLNGKASMHDVLFNVRNGERIDVMFHNMTTMAHPMHLHGHYFKVVNINGQNIDGALRDTVLVPVNAAVTIRFDADNPGSWALHCHHLYHQNSGMMGAIAYTGAA